MPAAQQLPVSPTLQPDPSPADRGTPTSAAPAAPTAPIPTPDQAATAPAETSAIARVIRIVRWLIAYGTLLATAVHEHPTEPLARSVAFWTNTPDLGVLLRRLTRGLIRAAALEAWLTERAAAGHELRDAPLRMPSSGNPRSAPPPAPPAAPPAGDAKPAPWWQDPDHVPTKEEAAAEVRSRPKGAVLAGISEDLRVLDCAMDPATWAELKHAIDRYGGDHVRMWIRDMRRKFHPDRLPESFSGDLPPFWQMPPIPGLTPAAARPP